MAVRLTRIFIRRCSQIFSDSSLSAGEGKCSQCSDSLPEDPHLRTLCLRTSDLICLRTTFLI